MPDGSSLVVAEESDWRSIDEWYVENSDVEEEPLDYQFPIEPDVYMIQKKEATL